MPLSVTRMSWSSCSPFLKEIQSRSRRSETRLMKTLPQKLMTISSKQLWTHPSKKLSSTIKGLLKLLLSRLLKQNQNGRLLLPSFTMATPKMNSHPPALRHAQKFSRLVLLRKWCLMELLVPQYLWLFLRILVRARLLLNQMMSLPLLPPPKLLPVSGLDLELRPPSI